MGFPCAGRYPGSEMGMEMYVMDGRLRCGSVGRIWMCREIEVTTILVTANWYCCRPGVVVLVRGADLFHPGLG